ncbi:MAG: hypothetical protein CME64_08190 [Halobacteriovoraceae bacterium]|nr:hypothetical protein [Halobacteriovoraceae bacterium]|tara:strand:- start:185288 stop:186550 length:1263 start_codon:yes stop_codon:yes gene_type:complete
MKLTTVIMAMVCLNPAKAIANDLDRELQRYVQMFKYEAIEKPQDVDQNKYVLGKKLFFDKRLSGNRNVSCATCHDPNKGTGDGLPLPVGVTKKTVIPRNSPPLFNLDHYEMGSLFWDGRVSYDDMGETFNTPSRALNGYYPKRMDITEVLGSALAAQAIFPIISHAEMRGMKGTNPIANAKTDEEAWKLLMERLLNIEEIKTLFEKAYPNQRLNIGHLGNALAEFQRTEFASYNTPWDRYLNGELDALSDAEKRGAIAFSTVGRCTQCHDGALLGGRVFANIASPQIGPGKDLVNNDEGRFYVTRRNSSRYQFRTPPLRNVALTAPYFHSGVYESLEEVIDHYTKGVDAIDEFDSRWLSKFENSVYGQRLFVETNPYKLFKKKENAHPLMRNKMIRLTSQEKKDLIEFLRVGLTDPRFKN